MELYHLTWASDGRRPLFPTETHRRRVVRTLARVAGPALVLFFLVDDHLHTVLGANKLRASRLAQAIYRAVEPLVSTPLDFARIRPVESRSHLEWLVKYVLTQGSHHGLEQHPALWTGSCFQDLVGARSIDGLALSLASHLPRFRLREAFSIVGLPQVPIEPADDDMIFRLGVVRLAEAAAAAASIGPGIEGFTAPVVQVRTVTAQVGKTVGFSSLDLSRVLGVSARSVRRRIQAPPIPQLERALRVRLSIEEIVGHR